MTWTGVHQNFRYAQFRCLFILINLTFDLYELNPEIIFILSLVTPKWSADFLMSSMLALPLCGLDFNDIVIHFLGFRFY
jgi:hypothetical protein